MTERSEAAARGWDDPKVRERRRDRVGVAVYSQESFGHPPNTFESVPKAFHALRLSEHPEPLKDATAKAVRLIIAQGGIVNFKGYEFRRKEK